MATFADLDTLYVNRLLEVSFSQYQIVVVESILRTDKCFAFCSKNNFCPVYFTYKNLDIFQRLVTSKSSNFSQYIEKKVSESSREAEQ